MATGCEQGVIAGGGVTAAVDALAKEVGCSRCVALQQQLEAQRWELVRERARQEEVKALRADITGAAALLFVHTAYGVGVWAWFVLECYAYHRPLRAVARALATMGVAVAPGNRPMLIGIHHGFLLTV